MILCFIAKNIHFSKVEGRRQLGSKKCKICHPEFRVVIVQTLCRLGISSFGAAHLQLPCETFDF